MNCNCQACQDIRHLRDCGVSEEFRNRWIEESMDNDFNRAILDGSWPTAVECLKAALENAIKMREEQK